ncbi:hypothetical protein DPMN_137427 [Dreissena polymorpha]|uniref:Uncharacterized protein n=1 Tax=Dreissena polymorpha TaxID=45954 RepID=A0A9D4G1T5_DREPO|nr:hypothetical protein DPMN_137427 [Dreissena polymorpha]
MLSMLTPYDKFSGSCNIIEIFINMGVKCFSSGPSPLVTECEYRLSQERILRHW